MSYTAAALITDAYYTSGIVSRDFESVNGSQLKDGLGLLNEFLTMQAAGTRMIPYYDRVNVTMVINQESYFVEDLVFAEDLTFNFSDVRYTLKQLTRSQYFGSFRVNNIQTLPAAFHVERELTGARVYIYPLPDRPYVMTITGKFALTTVEYEDDLELILDKFYIGYLKYALAERICASNSITFQPQDNEILKKYEKAIIDVSPIDFICNKVSILQKSTSVNWGDVNIGKGWRP